jgi:hypothetical protein
MHIMSEPIIEELVEQLRPAERTPQYQQSESAVIVMRHLRKLAKSRSYVRKTEVWRTQWKNYEVDYVDPVTGEVTEGWKQKKRKRKVNRRHWYLRNQTHGFLAVNDGELAARDIARLLGAEFDPDRKTDYRLVA